MQRLLEEEFPGIVHVRTDSLHKGVPNASHRFMRVSGTEDKLTALRQVSSPAAFPVTPPVVALYPCPPSCR